jgi:hypothetical protein
MLLDHLSQYLDKIESSVKSLEGIYVERYEEEILTVNRVNLRIRIRFQTGYMLEVNESIIGEENRITQLGYRYHFQDPKNNMVFRYDNTPHFPELDTYPHHKHLPEEVIPSKQLSIREVIEEARSLAVGNE